MGQLYLRVVLCHSLHYLSPEPGGIQHVGLIHAGNLFAPLHGDIKGFYRNTADFLLIVGKGIHGCHNSVHLFCMTCSEIQASREFPHDHHVKAVSDDFFL